MWIWWTLIGLGGLFGCYFLSTLWTKKESATARIDGQLTLITGVPGAGKSLRAMHYVMAAHAQGRKIVGNIDGVDASIMEPLEGEWYEQPEGTLVVLDEAQEIFRPASPHAKLPERIAKLETRRHQAVDIICTTQHPKFLHHNVRRLAGVHEHVTRHSSAYTVNVTWRDRAFDPFDESDTAEAYVDIWRYPKDLFDSYQSASLHTVQPRMPRKLVVGGGLAFGCLGLAGLLFTNAIAGLMGSDEPEADHTPYEVEQVATRSTERTTRELPEPPAGGIATADGRECRVVDDRGRYIDVGHATCMEWMENGRWEP